MLLGTGTPTGELLPVPMDMLSVGGEYQDLDKIGCVRQFESELSLHSLALFL